MKEDKKKALSEERFIIQGIQNSKKQMKDFGNTINSSKVKRNILKDDDVFIVEEYCVSLIVIRVPRVDYIMRPIYVGENRSLDAIKLFGYRPSFLLWGYYESLAKELSDSNMYADQNSGMARRCSEISSLGMDKELLRVLKKNIRIITSSDVYCPEDVADKIRELETCIANA